MPGEGVRFGLALVLALSTAAGAGLLTWQLTEVPAPRPLPDGETVVLERWSLTSRGVEVAQRLDPVGGDEAVLAEPGASIVVARVELTYTDEATLFETGCGVVFRTRDDSHEWRADNAAVYTAYGPEGHSCVMYPADDDEPADVELGQTVPLTFSVQVPAHLAEQVVAEVTLQHFLDEGPALRWHNGVDAAYLIG